MIIFSFSDLTAYSVLNVLFMTKVLFAFSNNSIIKVWSNYQRGVRGCRSAVCSVLNFSLTTHSSIALVCLPKGAVHRSESFSSRLFPSELQAELKNRASLLRYPQSSDIYRDNTAVVVCRVHEKVISSLQYRRIIEITWVLSMSNSRADVRVWQTSRFSEQNNSKHQLLTLLWRILLLWVYCQ